MFLFQPNQTIPPGTINFNEFADTPNDLDVSISAEDVAFLPYSSGTTGLPKGVQLTHRNIVANVCQLVHPEIGVNRETTSKCKYSQMQFTAALVLFLNLLLHCDHT